MMKVPYTVVIGQKEIESGQVTARIRGDLSSKSDADKRPIDDFLKTVASEAYSRSSKSTL
jgi:threonyl-tRNA synthetase